MMGIFGFDRKSAVPRHHIIEIIKYEGPNDVLLWKHPCEDFNTNAQLIVQEGQEAIFIKNGRALNDFIAGAYSLTTQNYPFIRALVGAATGSLSPFSCAIFYVNKTISMGIEWGTDSPVRMNDPVYNLPINITAHGDFSVQVVEPKRLLLQLVGTTQGFTQEELTQYFSGIMAKHIRSQLTATMIQNKLSPLGIDAALDIMSSLIEGKLADEFTKYGLRLNHFAVANIGYSGLEKVEMMLHDQTAEDIVATHAAERTRLGNRVEAENVVMQGQAVAQSNVSLGLTELQKQMLQVAQTQAANPGPIMSGNAMGIGFGGGSMPGFTSTMQSAGAATTESLKVIAQIGGQAPMQHTPQAPQQPDPGAMPGDMMGGMMEYADDQPEQPASQDDFSTRVKKLQMLKEAGILSDAEVESAKQKLLNEIMGGV